MNENTLTRGLAFTLVALMLAISGSALFAADPAGDSPANGLAVTCQVKSMAAGGTLWYKIPYRKGMVLTIDLTAIEGVYFDVFAPDQVKYFPTVGQALGQSIPDPKDPVFQRNWQGQLVQSDFILDYYYVRLTNTIGIEVQYQLCMKETPSLAVEPAGDTPANGLTSAPCALQFLDANSQIWHKIPYTSGKQFELYLKTISDALNFDVFTSEQIASWPDLRQPIGRGTVNRNEPEYAKSWQGHLMDSDDYYVRVINPSAERVQYQLCLTAKEFPGPYESPVPTRSIHPRRSSQFQAPN